MTKRYKGGLISGTTPLMIPSAASSIWSLTEQMQGMASIIWPVSNIPIVQVGTSVYDATSMGGMTDISQIASDPVAMGILPNSGYLKYKLSVGTNINDITVSFRKSNSTTLTQSAFSLFGETLAYVDSGVSAILYADNDDHDSLFMDADGRGVLARSNTASISNGNWTKFAGTTTVIADNTIDNVVTYPVSGYIASGQNGTLISFPLTNSGVWVSLTAQSYKTNNFFPMTMPAEMASINSTAAANSLYSISDGVNSFIIGRYGVTTAAYCKVDLTTGAITATAFAYTTAPVQSNNSEEDAIGTQLFTVDCFNAFHKDKIMYYNGPNDWLSLTEPFALGFKSTFTAGPGSTASTLQADMDIFGSVDPSDRSVWFADWGHDDGGLYNVRTDIELGTRKTNIKLIPTTYSN